MNQKTKKKKNVGKNRKQSKKSTTSETEIESIDIDISEDWDEELSEDNGGGSDSEPQGFSGNPTADFGSRFAAFCADSVILFSFLWTVIWLISRTLRSLGAYNQFACDPNQPLICSEAPTALIWICSILILVVVFGYNIYLDGTRGATIGKRLLSLQVRDIAQRNDRIFTPIGPARAAARTAVKFIPLLIAVSQILPYEALNVLPEELTLFLFAIALLVLASGAFSRHGLSIYDQAAGSTVLDRRLIGLPAGARFVEHS